MGLAAFCLVKSSLGREKGAWGADTMGLERKEKRGVGVESYCTGLSAFWCGKAEFCQRTCSGVGWRGTVLGYQHFGVVKPSFARELGVGWGGEVLYWVISILVW